MSPIHMILQTKYVAKSHGSQRLVHKIIPMNIAIRRSHQPIQAHPEITICKKKKLNIASAQISACRAGKSVPKNIVNI